MIYLLHGSDTVSSRTFLSKLKSQYQDVTVIDCKKLTSETIILPQGSMLSTQELVVLENFAPKKGEVLKNSGQTDIAIWIDREITSPNWVDKTLVFQGKDQAATFKFADSLSYGQEKIALLSVEKLMSDNTPPEMVIGSLVRQFRLMLFYFAGEKEKISASSFLQQKVSDQAKNWSIRKIKSALLLILKADLGIKAGKISPRNGLTLLAIDVCRLIN